MKTLISLSFSCFVSLFYLACNKSDDVIPSSTLGASFELAFEATTELSDANIKVTFTDMLEDSRCPEDRVCAWEGLVNVALNLEIDGTPHAIELIDQAGHPQKAQTVIDGRTVRLVSVEPAKLTANEIAKDEYVIVLVIE